MSIIRWKYVVPRLGLLVLVAGGVHFGADPTLKWLLISAGESSVGAKVEVAELTSSLCEGRLDVVGLQVANPQDTMSNLFEAESLNLKIDSRALLQKRLVIEDGEILGIQIGTDRAESGELEITIGEPTSKSKLLSSLKSQLGTFEDQWLEGVDMRLSAGFYDQLQTPQLAQKLEDKWKSQAADLRARAEALKQRGKQLEDEFRELKANPLRGVQRLPELQAELTSVQGELKSLEGTIKSLPEAAKQDRQVVLEAKAQDQEFLQQQLQFDRLDGDNLTQVILGETVAGNLQSACDWIAWTRAHMPKGADKQVRAQRSRGTFVRFGPRQPRLEVQRVALKVLTQVGGKPMPFVGQLTNLSSEPSLLAEPARLSLMAQGEIPVEIELASDHRTDAPFEELELSCPTLPLAGRSIPAGGKFSLALAPTVADLSAHLVLRGDELSGEVQFAQQQFALTASSTSKQGQILASLLQQAGSNVKGIQANVTISGTLKRPAFKIDSQLGDQLADGIRTALKQAATERSEKLMARLTGEVDTRLAQLQSARDSLQQELLAKLGKHQQLFQELAALGSGQTPGLSIPKLSSKLGSGLLRK